MWTRTLPDHHANINHTLPSCVCSLIPSGTHTQTIRISAASLNPVWGGGDDLGIRGAAGGSCRQLSRSCMGGGARGRAFFPGKNPRVYSGDWRDTIGAFLSCWWGVGAQWRRGAGSEHHIWQRETICIFLLRFTLAIGVYGCKRKQPIATFMQTWLVINTAFTTLTLTH